MSNQEHDWRLYDRDNLFVCQHCGLFRGDDTPQVCAGPAHALAAVATTDRPPVMAAPQPPVDYEAKFERIASALAAENERLHARVRELERIAAGNEAKDGDRFYNYDPDGAGFEEHDTAEEAQAAAEEALQNCADEASEGWPAGTQSIHWGRLLPLGVIVEESGTAEQDSQARVAGFSGWVNYRFAAQPDELALLRSQVAHLDASCSQLQTQLAGCLTAAEGATASPAVKGNYGWSVAYQKVLELRREHDATPARWHVIRCALRLLEVLEGPAATDNVHIITAERDLQEAVAALPASALVGRLGDAVRRLARGKHQVQEHLLDYVEGHIGTSHATSILELAKEVTEDAVETRRREGELHQAAQPPVVPKGWYVDRWTYGDGEPEVQPEGNGLWWLVKGADEEVIPVVCESEDDIDGCLLELKRQCSVPFEAVAGLLHAIRTDRRPPHEGEA